MVTHATIQISTKIKKRLDDARAEYIAHHPEMKEIPISYNKIIHEVVEYYLK